jgi:hypothetical protein
MNGGSPTRNHIWAKSVEITLDGGTHFRGVASPRDALECLLNNWPEPHGKAHAGAKRACLKSHDGKANLQTAQHAFMKAAVEEGILRQ